MRIDDSMNSSSSSSSSSRRARGQSAIKHRELNLGRGRDGPRVGRNFIIEEMIDFRDTCFSNGLLCVFFPCEKRSSPFSRTERFNRL
jgi:hypothetical protein